MVGSLLMAGAALRAGLVLRRARAARRPAPPGARQRHLRLARPAVVFVCVGFAGGLASSLWLRGFTPLASFHGLLGVLALALFLATARMGFRLERGDAGARALHARLGAGALLASVAAAIAGLVLLP
jgi:hypothetical protein